MKTRKNKYKTIIETIPVDFSIYRGTNYDDEKKIPNYKPVWFATTLKDACYYIANKNGALEIYQVDEELHLLNVSKIDPTIFPSKKDIKLGNVYVSLRELFKVLFGRGIKKTPYSATLDDIQTGKYNGTQLVEFIRLLSYLPTKYGKNPLDATIKWLKILEKFKQNLNLRTNDINRLSDGVLDYEFIQALKKIYPTLDGYYAPDLKSELAVQNCSASKHPTTKFVYPEMNMNNSKCRFEQQAELGLFDTKKISITKRIKNKKICSYV